MQMQTPTLSNTLNSHDAELKTFSIYKKNEAGSALTFLGGVSKSEICYFYLHCSGYTLGFIVFHNVNFPRFMSRA